MSKHTHRRSPGRFKAKKAKQPKSTKAKSSMPKAKIDGLRTLSKTGRTL